MKVEDLTATLNQAQRAIATTLDRPLFVEAGAGSGKTFTLTQRIAWALAPGSGRDGAPFLDSIDQVLVITFTEAAAREIRERVRSTLREAGTDDLRMREASLAVDSAWISTIHGMCSRILHRHALDLGLDPLFRVCSENQADEMLYGAMVSVMGEARKDVRYSELFATYDLGMYGTEIGYTGAMGLVRTAMTAARRCPGGYENLYVPTGATDDDGVRSAMRRLAEAVETLAACPLTAKAAEAMAPLCEALDVFHDLPVQEQTAQAADELLTGCKLPRASKAIEEEQAEAKVALGLARLEIQLALASPVTGEVLDLARRVDAAYRQLKTAQSLLDNDDLIDLALRAVRDNAEVRCDYAGRFRLVMVDEFQDTDAAQLELIRLLAGDDGRHLCTVGDAQQSIYRFRGADVGVFREQGACIDTARHMRLDVNYRSHADILSFVERICGGTREMPGVLADYMHLDAFSGRKDGYTAVGLPRIALEAVGGRGRAGRASKKQVAMMAERIADRLKDYADHGCDPGDMALLLGVTTHADLYVDALRARGLECVVTGGSTFTATDEAQIMCALLHTLANPSDTQSGLFRLLASEMFGLDAGDFCLLGTRAQEKLSTPAKRPIDRGLMDMSFYGDKKPSARLVAAHEVLTEAWTLVGTEPIADLCLRVLRTSGWLARLEAEGEQGRARAANALAAVRYIRDLTATLGIGPARAAVEFERWLGLAKVPPASLAGGITRTVQVMTIHASKGLEFPLVAVAECWANAKTDAGFLAGPDPVHSTRWVACVSPPGISRLIPGMPYGDEGDSLKGSASLTKRSASLGKRSASLAETFLILRDRVLEEDRAEKARLLYVALTRAREALVVGLSCAGSKTAAISSELASAVMHTLVGTAELEPGEQHLAYGGSEPAMLHTTIVAHEQVQEESVPALEDDDPEPYVLYRREPEPDVSLCSWRAREEVFSYSFLQRLSQEESTSRPQPLTAREHVAEADGALHGSEDADRATNLGSAFHELAQAMVESGQTPDTVQVERMATYWNLSDRATARLQAAVTRWIASDIRAEAEQYDVRRAEVPFFVSAPEDLTTYGRYLEGAIDLLCYDTGTDGLPIASTLLIDYKTGDRSLNSHQIYERHRMQAELYATVLKAQGFEHVTCAFVCVERDAGELTGTQASGQPYVVRYLF